MFKWTRIASNLPFGFVLTQLESDPAYLRSAVKRVGVAYDRKQRKWGSYLRINNRLWMLYQPLTPTTASTPAQSGLTSTYR